MQGATHSFQEAGWDTVFVSINWITHGKLAFYFQAEQQQLLRETAHRLAVSQEELKSQLIIQRQLATVAQASTDIPLCTVHDALAIKNMGTATTAASDTAKAGRQDDGIVTDIELEVPTPLDTNSNHIHQQQNDEELLVSPTTW